MFQAYIRFGCYLQSIQRKYQKKKGKTIHPRGPSAPSFIAYAALNPFTVTNSATNSEFPLNLASQKVQQH